MNILETWMAIAIKVSVIPGLYRPQGVMFTQRRHFLRKRLIQIDVIDVYSGGAAASARMHQFVALNSF